jgi:RNA polymerase sigma-70 factor (ECF subfamily)
MNANSMLLAETRRLTKQDLIGIYDEHSPALFRYAVRLLGDRQLAEDCVSETFSRFLGALQQGGGPSANVRAYLYRVAHNWITDHYRRKDAPTLPLDIEIKDDEMTNPFQKMIHEMEQDRVRRALLRLPEEQQQVVNLRFLEDWSHIEIAGLLGKTVEATRALQYRALVSLRQMLVDLDDEVHHD